MFEFIKNFWTEIFALTKTWSIRKQMLVCYIISMILILILILLLVLLNVYILRFQTVQEIDKTLNNQAHDNMQSLVRETAVYMHSEISQVTAMFGIIQEILSDMEDEDRFSLDYLLSYTASQLPEKCWGYDINNQKVCMTYSSYMTTTSSYDNDYLRKISRLDNIWPSIMELTNNIAIRYFMYFPDKGIYKIFPGMFLPKGFDPNETIWYTTFNESTAKSFGTSAYPDPFKSGLNIITVGYPLKNITDNKTIGVICADLPLDTDSYLFQDIYSVSYLKKGFTSVAYHNGTIMDLNSSFWDPNTNIKELNEELWLSMIHNYHDTHYFIFKDNIFRITNFWLGVNYYDKILPSEEDYCYNIMLIIEESEVMKYRDDSKTKIDDAASYLVVITIVCSIITIAVVTVLIHFLAKSITAPLKGIIEFTNKINAKATEKDMITNEELEELKEGDDQVAELVKNFKDLAGSLITKTEDKVAKPVPRSLNRVYPRNEYYQKNKLEWKKLIESLPNNE